jgi:hypothetical protein
MSHGYRNRECNFVRFQVVIPEDLSEARYISGVHALNLPPPERTSGDWHPSNVFFHEERDVLITLAGKGTKMDTNHIFQTYGIYLCNETLESRGLKINRTNGITYYAANHYRAILDVLYESVSRAKYPYHLDRASEDYLDTDAEKQILLEKASIMLPFFPSEKRKLLQKWLDNERLPGYKS